MDSSNTPPKFSSLNLGAGKDRKEGFINLDWNEISGPDVVHDLNVIPYPFVDGAFDEILASHILEHLDRPFIVMKELHRILKPGGMLVIKVPHFSRGFTHAEHTHGFDVTFPMYFNKCFSVSGYLGVDFRLEKMELHWLAYFHLLSNMGYGITTLKLLRAVNAAITFLANLSPTFASRIWCFWVGGFDELEFRFRCEK